MLNELKGQMDELTKELGEQKEIINSLLVGPKKTEYLVGEVKKELLAVHSVLRKEMDSDMRELRNYIHTLHTDVQANLTGEKRTKE